MTRYFEDVAVGDTFESEDTEHVTRDAILDFARAWDPQTYHVDEQAAKASFAGDISACGVHTLAISMKLAHRSGFFDILPVVGLGVDELRLLKPVLPGDRLAVRVTITAMRPSNSRPGQGIITNRTELINQAGQVVLRFALSEIVNRRPGIQD
ncbi:acyl dehydratase [Vineibacter terrae]|uniref:Acyl dehydratase n=1 Tax=Vineibacter terrae TaxID=2586908 RepID=A0A5C8PS26_9HYPH|nr:MaoC/PaaZ C-terminal domain-containing protein [Vineibacter terrae]TXL78697.1 acyl dehydratase [Vineibacter terrae]